MIINFKQTDPCIIYLVNSDPLLGKVIKKIGDYSLELDKNYYLKLTSSIVGQQLSNKAKSTIWSRVETLCKEISPQNIIAIPDEQLRMAGISFAKISYIKGLSQEILNGNINLNNMKNQTNDEVLQTLTSIKGIGKWTSEMFLIFSLGRLDVFSADDASLRRAIKWLYSFKENPTKDEMNNVSKQWIPYCSIASLYLWASVDSGLINQPSSFI
ncbi:DNA-3-methyladenine glycosylase family protein [Alkaliphilus sp. B6464]|uniref:DNA-3-methyladenine glycosylase family protein n=1 Tax=Alkaliphilus sp. B6464 TaxID=2731219 RepID=UPI001BA677CF|nr:DNA-3-methyladenine glycosylase 2 family protein [Alkaliphilus sp. B6464]QUH21248.1 DNA-3-methyladenine glycosylase 2 family protein [Alkaliphilus sp. B6464]